MENNENDKNSKFLNLTGKKLSFNFSNLKAKENSSSYDTYQRHLKSLWYFSKGIRKGTLEKEKADTGLKLLSNLTPSQRLRNKIFELLYINKNRKDSK